MPVVEKSLTNQTSWDIGRDCRATGYQCSITIKKEKSLLLLQVPISSGLRCGEGFKPVFGGQAFLCCCWLAVTQWPWSRHSGSTGECLSHLCSQCPLRSACWPKYLNVHLWNACALNSEGHHLTHVAARTGGTTVDASLKLLMADNFLL